MTRSLYWKCAAIALLGVLAHIIIVKLPSYKSKCEAANKRFSVLEYFQQDGLRILGSIVTIGLLMAAWDEWVGWNQALLVKAKSLFAFIGFAGSSLLLGIFGVANKKVMDLLGLKANAFDNATSGQAATTVEDVKVKADEIGVSTETPKQ
jgi:hypothetical protein